MTRVTMAVAVGLALCISAGTVAAQKISLMNPAAFKAEAPATYNVKFDTSAGVFVAKVTRDWAPKAADRFYNLVKNGFYDGIRFHRVMPNFMAQFGVNGNPTVASIWSRATFAPDPVKQSNKRMFADLRDGRQSRDRQHAGLHQLPRQLQPRRPGLRAVWRNRRRAGRRREVAQRLRRRAVARRKGPDNARMFKEGMAYLEKEFPKLDYIKQATIEP